ncbi:MAG: ribonuclease H-like domain-containing protein [Thermoplasmata archaeon]
MLRATFQHLPGFGPGAEVELWRNGVRDWTELLSAPTTRSLPDGSRARIEREVAASERALSDRDVAWFGRRLPEREHWRLYPEFERETSYLDIETTGLSPYGGIVTVASVYARGETRTFLAGEDLEELPAYLGQFPVLVTFNGSRFDVPFLRAVFPAMAAPPVHIDLRFLLYRLGISGGLKRIESTLGLGDRSGVEGIDGLQAVRLWQEYRRGNRSALETLVRYNRADTTNLEPLLRLSVDRLSSRLLRADGPGGAAAAAVGTASRAGV